MIALLLAKGFEEVEALTPVDFLRRAGIEVKIVGIGGLLIEGSHGITVQADLEIRDLPADVAGVIVPGGMPGAEHVARSEEALSLICSLNAGGRLVAAICAAPAIVLEKTGVLKGKNVTCYPGFENRLHDCTFREDRIVVDGNLITSRGPGTAAEFSIAVVEKIAGRMAARKLHNETLQQGASVAQ